MKKLLLFTLLTFVGGLGFAGAASAQNLTCDDLVWSAAVLANNPNVDAACLDVVNIDGVPNAKFHARVVRQSVNSTIVQWQLPDGSWSPSQRRYPERGFLARLQDKEVRIMELPERQEVNVYVPASTDTWSVPMAEAATASAAPAAAAAAPVAAAAAAPAPEPEPEPEPAMLPTTATQLPLLALLGGVLILLGGAVGITRTRL